MTSQAEIDKLRADLAELKIKTSRSRWIFKQALKKIFLFPIDTIARLRKSYEKRWGTKSKSGNVNQTSASIFSNLNIAPTWLPYLKIMDVNSHSDAKNELRAMRDFQKSDEFQNILNDAIALEPNIAPASLTNMGHLAPWFDETYAEFSKARDVLPTTPVENVVLVPFGKLGGADYVAGLLSRALVGTGKTIIIRTELPDWDRPDWYPEPVDAIDLSGILKNTPNPTKTLYSLLRHLNPKAIFNVNSRTCFDVLHTYGRQLSHQSKLYAYYFCSDYTNEGHEAGYPVSYMADVLPHLTSAFCDTNFLRENLIKRYQIPKPYQKRLRTLYTPNAETLPDVPVVQTQIESMKSRERPLIIWAGRLDRQKRFDIVQQVANAMPDIDFYAWGKAVLDQPPKLSKLPQNLHVKPPFKSYDEMPLTNCDGWLYTAAWDGLPTILIEIAGKGFPIVASAVGGVPELINDTTGWPVRDVDDPQSYVKAIRSMLASPDDRMQRALSAQKLVFERHNVKNYEQSLYSETGVAGSVT